MTGTPPVIFFFKKNLSAFGTFKKGVYLCIPISIYHVFSLTPLQKNRKEQGIRDGQCKFE